MAASSSQTPKRKALGGGLYQRGDSFFAIVRKDGTQHVKALQATNRSEAKRELPRVLAELLDRPTVAVGDRNATLGALAESFLEHEAGPSARIGPNTLTQRRILLRKHVLPGLGAKTKANDLTAAHVRALIAKLNRKGLSGSSVRSCIASLSGVLNHGARLGMLPRNVCRDLVRGDLPSAKRLTEPRYLTKEEAESLLAHLGDVFRPVEATCFYGGLRITEVLSLRWKDIDFDESEIAVPGTKTKTSAAPIPLLPKLAEELKAHRQRQAALGLQWIKEGALVFPTSTGKPQSRRNALRAVNAASVKAGLVPEGEEKVSSHDLRHSLAAFAFAEGLTLPEVTRMMRHANPAVTLAVYAGLAGNQIEGLREKLAALSG